MKTIAFVPLLISALLAVLVIVGFLRDAEPITAVNPVLCATTVPVATATPDGGPTYTPTVTHTPCFIKLTPTPTPPPDTAMSLRVDASQQTSCSIPAPGKVCVGWDQKFDVVVVADAIPSNGYILAQAWLDYDSQGLVHKKSTQNLWPDCHVQTFVTSQDAANNGAYAGCFAGLFPPMPASFHTGDLYSFSLTCTSSLSSSQVTLIPYNVAPAGTSGALFLDAVTGTQLIPAVTGITVSCEHVLPTPTFTPSPTPEPKPGDTDGDGCADAHESGPDETQGGLRDYLDPNDYYDVLGPSGSLTLDGVIDLPNDILGVIQHFSPQGQSPYEVRFDRGVTIGANHWERNAPDGVIDLPNDILGVIQQFGHNCT